MQNDITPAETNGSDRPSDAGDRWPHVARHWALILATPFLQLAINGNLFINPNTNVWIDDWVYTGFFLSLPEHLARWGHTYYATRLSWLLPGFAAHQLFSPVLANYVLHLTFLYILLFAVYSLVTAGVNRSAAFVVTLLVAWSPEVLAAMSWDYVDGAVTTYFTLTLLCLERASSSRTREWLWTAAAGAILVCMASANLAAITLWPICFLFFFLKTGATHWRATLPALVVASGGAAATFAALSLVNRQLGGQWLFLAPSVSYVGDRMWLPSPWDVQGIAWLKDANSLVLPALAAFGACLALIRKPRIEGSFTGRLQLTFLVAASWWVVHSTLWTHSIHISFYTSYLVPLGLLTLAIHPDSPLARITTTRLHYVIALELATLGVLVAAHILVFRHGDLAWTAIANSLAAAFPTAYRFNAVAAFTVGGLAVISLGFVRTAWFRWPAFLLALWLAYGSVPMNWATADTPHLREDFALTVSAHRFIAQHLDENRRLRMWYALRAGEVRPFKNISSTYLWGWILVNEEMPSLSENQAASLIPDSQVVLLVADRAEIKGARQALQKSGLDYTPQVQRQFGRGDSTFWVVLGDLSRTAQPRPDLSDTQ